MKYSSTIRILNLALFLILFAVFVSLGIWAGILVTPFIIRGYGPIDLPDLSVALPWELGAFGLAGALMCLFGFALSLKGIIHGNDDRAVRDAISCYIGLGFLVALFLFLNGAWLYRLTTTNFGYSELAFAIAFFLVLAIIIIIGVNVPFVKMHGDDVNQNSQMSLISGVSVCANFGAALPGILALIFSGAEEPTRYIMPKLLTIALIPAVACLLSLLAFFRYRKGEKTGAVSKLNAFAFEGSLLLDGAAILAAGVFSYVYAQETSASKTSLISSSWNKPDVNYLDFSVMSWIIGGVLVLVALCLLASTIRPAKNAKAAQ